MRSIILIVASVISMNAAYAAHGGVVGVASKMMTSSSFASKSSSKESSKSKPNNQTKSNDKKTKSGSKDK